MIFGLVSVNPPPKGTGWGYPCQTLRVQSTQYGLGFVLVSGLQLEHGRRYLQLSFPDLRVFLLKGTDCTSTTKHQFFTSNFQPAPLRHYPPETFRKWKSTPSGISAFTSNQHLLPGPLLDSPMSIEMNTSKPSQITTRAR